MLQSLVIVAALWDLIPWIPVLVIIAVLSAFGIVYRGPRSSRWDDDYKDKP
ncbi:hypothetical protein [Lacipirellula limnantheis]|uniref:Uncharacterized protein n=1 Tax=Lacipirellula limnantheis TaxID=2528024 RepID=A0A517TVR2_9BACT|nr:hypothetical protein [Lacipirellula limnantheis]QDT72465.1 hypothetical protein I41_16430 [Lacipirellula limnantheis]